MAQPYSVPTLVTDNPQPQQSERHVPWVVTTIVCSLIFVLDLIVVLNGTLMVADRHLIGSIHSTFGPRSYGFFEALSTLGDGQVRLVIVVAVILFLVYIRRLYSAGAVAIGVGGAALLSTVIKALVNRPRPLLFPYPVATSGASFPSGHTTNTVALCFVLVVILWHTTRTPALTTIASILGAAFSILVGLSRIVLGVHYPTDVIGGFAVSGAWVSVTVLMFLWAMREDRSTRFERSP